MRLSVIILLVLITTRGLTYGQPLLYNGGTTLFIQQDAVLAIEGNVMIAEYTPEPPRIQLEGDMLLHGNWWNESPVPACRQEDQGWLTLTGNSGSRIFGGSFPVVLPSCRLDLTGISVLELEQATTILHTLDLGNDRIRIVQGDLILGGTSPYHLQRDGGFLPPYHADSLAGTIETVGGALLRRMTGYAGESFDFPICVNDIFRPLRFQPKFSDSLTLAVQLISQLPPDHSRYDSSILSINPDWYYTVQGSNQIPGNTEAGQLEVYFEAARDGVCDLDGIGLGRSGATGWFQYPNISRTENTGWLSLLHHPQFIFTQPNDTTPFPMALIERAGSGLPPDCIFPSERLILSGLLEEQHFLLSWESGREEPSDQYQIWRYGKDSTFVKVEELPAAGQPDPPFRYTWTDTKLELNNRYLYQVRQVDQDGGLRYSNTIETVLSGTEPFTSGVSPVPGNGRISLYLTAPRDLDLELKLINALGQFITGETVVLSSGAQNISLDYSGLAAGIYILQLQTPGYGRNHKIIIEH